MLALYWLTNCRPQLPRQRRKTKAKLWLLTSGAEIIAAGRIGCRIRRKAYLPRALIVEQKARRRLLVSIALLIIMLTFYCLANRRAHLLTVGGKTEAKLRYFARCTEVICTLGIGCRNLYASEQDAQEQHQPEKHNMRALLALFR